MSNFIYNMILCILFPFIFLQSFSRFILVKAYRKDWKARFGFINLFAQQGGILIHAVSLGETVAASALIQKLLKEYPHIPLYCTSHTLTGADKVQDLYGDKVFKTFLPYDFPWAVHSFLNKLKPRLVILVESELWPNLIHACDSKKIPIVLINARLSPQSFIWHQRLKYFSKPVLQKLSQVFAQSELDKKRFLELGIESKKIILAGNLKFIINLPKDLKEKAEIFRSIFSPECPLWIAASTHPIEEELILKAQQKIQKKIPGTRLLLVPRHPERFQKVYELSKKYGFSVAKRSEMSHESFKDIDIIIGDSIGELLYFYKAADLALVCGSLIPVGGHSLIEPAAIGLPLIMGQYYFKTQEIAEELIKRQALRIVIDEMRFAKEVIFLLNHREQSQAMIVSAKKFVEENQQALGITFNYLRPYL